ncbi:hypothetical protein FA95DRAFT_1608741 [Auriscalpium vulgare]|uniref:Uncharacterized protein n=1 Tax=Auriscalpium vulgare TaxID=40419 RepID=A0ACB8RKW8_9AGAM|nr:hypothetical protein FA95DRAFT_1608741 [Auriscalpium vulgare]
MFLFGMDSIFAIGLGLTLRLIVDTASSHNVRLGGSLVGLWEGAVLYHFLEKWPKSFDPYIALVFRLFVDFLFTESLARLTIVLLWAGIGMVLSDVTPAFVYDKNLRRFYKRTRRYFRHLSLPSFPFPFPFPTTSYSRVHFYDIPARSTSRSQTATSTTTTSAPTVTVTPSQSARRRYVPGRFPGYASESSAATSVRRPVAASSLPSAMRSANSSKSSSGSSVSFELVPSAAELPTIEDLEDVSRPFTGGALPVPPPPMAMPVPEVAEPSGPPPVVPPVDSLPEITVPEEVRERTPPPPFSEVAPYSKGKQPDQSSDGADTARSSIISTGNRNSILLRADLLRDQAFAEETERDRYGRERKKALAEKRYPDALRFKVDYEEAHERAMSLHERAARRYFKAHNLANEVHTIDVHRLKVPEAVRQTEVAIRNVLLEGGSQLRVITGRGNHSAGKIPVLKLALIGKMEEHRINTEVDSTNPGVLIVKLPVS